jgi:hypothetical protein
LADLRAAGLIHHASERADITVEQVLPLEPRLRALFPGGALRRGTTIAISPPGSGPRVSGASASSSGLEPASAGLRSRATQERATREGDAWAGSGPRVSGASASSSGSSSLLLALLAEASAAGTWCAVVGLPQFGLVAAAEAGIAVERVALVPYPGPEWTSVVAALLDGVDIVVAATPGGVPAQVASRLAARARQRGAVLVPVGRWTGADLTLSVVDSEWHGVGQGRGRLRGRQLEIVAHGRGAAARTRRLRLDLPEAPRPVAPLIPLHGRDLATRDLARVVIPLRRAS